jgi:hypothetical protein
MTVVMLDINAQGRFEITLFGDEEPVEARTPERADEPFGECSGERCLDRGADDPWPLGAEHLIEAGDVLTVPIADEEGEGEVVPAGDEVAGLLGDPGGISTGGDADFAVFCQLIPDRPASLAVRVPRCRGLAPRASFERHRTVSPFACGYG